MGALPDQGEAFKNLPIRFSEEPKKMSKANLQCWYDLSDPDKALAVYLKTHDNLYDNMKVHTIDKVSKKMLPSLKVLKVLEVGSGGGIWTGYFIKNGAEVTCVDIREQILEANKKIHPEAKVILGDATTIKLYEKFDLIFAKDIIEHIENDSDFMKNMADHLVPGGHILIKTQNSFCLNFLVQEIFHRLKRNKKWFGWDPTHVRFYNYKSLKKLLDENDLKPTGWFGSYYFPYRLLSDRLGEKWDSKIFCLIEILGLFDKNPFSISGWNIGVIAKKDKHPTPR